MKMKKPTIYTTGQVAKLCAVSIRTVARWIEMGHLKSFRLPGEGSEFRVKKDDLLAFMKKFDLPTDHIAEDLGHKIVILEEDQRLLQALAEALEDIQFPHTLKTYSEPIQGLIAIGRFQPHLIIFNYKMKNFHGKELHDFVQIEPKWQNTKLLIIVEKEDSKEALKLQKTGFCFVLVKPVNYEDYAKKVVRLLKKVDLK